MIAIINVAIMKDHMNNDQENWNARLLQVAKEHPDAPGKTGEMLRARLAQHAFGTFSHDLQLAHARAREAVLTGVRMSIRCGVLLTQAPSSEVATLIRSAGIPLDVAKHYEQMALGCPELWQRCEHRNGRITETEALGALRGNPNFCSPTDPVADLRKLLSLND